MKLFLLISLVFSTTHAFQHSIQLTKPSRVSSALSYYPDSYVRAVQCTTHFDTCDLDELEQLAQDLEQFQTSETGGLLQGKEHYQDILLVQEMLEMQSQLKDFTDGVDVQQEHRKPSAVPSFLGMLEQTLSPVGELGRKSDHGATVPFLDMLQTIKMGPHLKPDNFATPQQFLDILNTAITSSKNLRKKSDAYVIRPFLDILKTITATDNFNREVRKREITPFLDMLEQVVRGQVQQEHRKASAIPSFLEMLEQTLSPVGELGRKSDHGATVPYLDMLQTIKMGPHLKPDNFAIPPHFLDILNTAITNSKNLRKKSDAYVIRPFLDILNTITTIDGFNREVRKREITPFLDMLEQVV